MRSLLQCSCSHMGAWSNAVIWPRNCAALGVASQEVAQGATGAMHGIACAAYKHTLGHWMPVCLST